MKRAATHRASRQRGVTLIVVMLILVVVTIVGIGGAQIALLAERSTRYDRDYLIASQGAEAALMDAEIDISPPVTAVPVSATRAAIFKFDNNAAFVAGCGTDLATRGLCASAAAGAAQPVWASVNFLDASASPPTVQYGTYTNSTFDAGAAGIQPALAPRYIIEMVVDRTPGKPATPPLKLYRITAMGFGPRSDIQVVMQTTFRR